jgi:hypothetical protein
MDLIRGWANIMNALTAPCTGPGRIIIGLLRNAAKPVTLPRSSLIPWTIIPGSPIAFTDSATRSRSPTEDPPVVNIMSQPDRALLILDCIFFKLSGVIPNSKEMAPEASINLDKTLLLVFRIFPGFTLLNSLVSSLPVGIIPTRGLLNNFIFRIPSVDNNAKSCALRICCLHSYSIFCLISLPATDMKDPLGKEV